MTPTEAAALWALAIGAVVGFGVGYMVRAGRERANPRQLTQEDVDRIVEAGREDDGYRDIEREVEEMEDAIDWSAIGVVTPERRGM